MSVESLTTDVTGSVSRVADTVFMYLPSVLGSLTLLLAGWLVAKLLRAGTVHLASRGLDQLSRQRVARTKAIDQRTQQSTAYQSVPTVVGGIVFWTVLLFFLAAAIEALGLPAVSRVISLVTAYLPRVLAGVIIVLVGVWAGEFTRTLLVRAAARARFTHAELLGRVCQALVVLVFIIIATDQLGIDSTILVTTLAIAFAATAGAAALAFGLGARTTVANIIATHYVKRAYKVGDSVRLGEHEGTVVEIGDTAVMLDGKAGRLMIPTARFAQDASVLLKKEVRRADP
ncbi:MAG: mechanosensitive ion channel [Gammaproteobacteria bacterium]|nr:mechanosensitive ion channel [Gammaproteobacteria bacterium]